MKKVWFCEQSERCMFIICETVSTDGWHRAMAGRAIYRDVWKLHTPETQAALFESHIKSIDHDILQIGAL